MVTKVASEPRVVLEGFIGSVDGEERAFRTGDLVAADDPAIAKWPQFFGPQVIGSDRPPVEQATAAPGEKRGA
jgi:hypothetical protein